jgi:hypothetical protein
MQKSTFYGFFHYFFRKRHAGNIHRQDISGDSYAGWLIPPWATA